MEIYVAKFGLQHRSYRDREYLINFKRLKAIQFLF